ncbi:hypothetical protein [Psychrobacter sp. SMN/5/1215-MNA-CIBAN-0208]|uniref:hypothetical protein n=1 Tax=Psychrobacter sp. SMN/5/1215-MNA-CIBAN-0208 TaxID=3140442 RepID=UPI003321D7AB
MITQNKKVRRIYSTIINEAQDADISINLLNLDNLSMPLQLLAKARYNLSVIHDELLHIAINGLLDRGQIAQFTANLNTELQQIRVVFLNYEDSLKKPAESLPHMVFDRLCKPITILFMQYSAIGCLP